MQKKRQECIVYSRVCGFLTPISQWNVGKKAEFFQRVEYNQQLKEAK